MNMITNAEFSTLDKQNQLERLISTSAKGLAERQNKDGHWLFELEADATIPAEYIMFMHCLLYTSPSPRDATLSRMPSSA